MFNKMSPILGKRRLTLYQNKILMKEFAANCYVNEEKQQQLATSLNISAERIVAWYAHKRFEKRKDGSLTMGEYTETNCAFIPYCIHFVFTITITPHTIHKTNTHTQTHKLSV